MDPIAFDENNAVDAPTKADDLRKFLRFIFFAIIDLPYYKTLTFFIQWINPESIHSCNISST